MIGVIADDLTGAAEIGGIGLRQHLKAEVLLRGGCDADADLICVDTDSRSCTAREAARRAAAGARKLQKAGAVWIYKKVDSVLRGHVIAEVQAIKRALGLKTALLVPANPCFGRIIRGGRYFVNGIPIEQTDFARDPEHPRTSSDVLALLDVGGTQPVTVSRLAEPLPASGTILGEVSTSEDVQEWVARRKENMLLAGGAEFFGAALNVLHPAPKKLPFPDSTTVVSYSEPIRELFVCGSSSDFTNDFTKEARASGTPVFSLLELAGKDLSFRPASLDTLIQSAITAFHAHRRVILTVGRPIIEMRTAAQKLAKQLVNVAVSVIVGAKPKQVYCDGGATAAELVRRLGWDRMKVLKVIAPGVTTLSPPDPNMPLLTIKPGSYPGWPK
jgi:uncharacterized protein YgbK (DUF1537 family)